MTQQHHANPELRAARAAMRAPEDPLSERQRSAAYWTARHQDNPAYGLNHARTFYRKTNFRYLLLPRTRAYLQARHDAAKAAFRAQLRESVEQARRKKALAEAPPLPLFS